MSENQQVAAIAAQFGYDTKKRGNVFVLEKVFEEVDDLPEISLEECAWSLQCADAICRRFDPHFGAINVQGDPIAQEIFGAFSSREWEAISHGGLPVKSMSSDQRQHMRRFACFYYIQAAAQAIHAAAVSARSGIQPHVRFEGRSINNVVVTGFVPADGPGDRFIPVDRQSKMLLARGVTISGYTTKQGVRIPDKVVEDSTPPLRTLQSASTLTSVIDSLNRRPNNGRIYEVDPSLAQKTITVVGLQLATPGEEFKAISDIYGLRIAQSGSVYSLRLPILPAVNDISSLGPSLAQTIPSPVRRFLQARLLPLRKRWRSPEPMPPGAYFGAADQLQKSAIGAFIAMISPKLPKEPKTVVEVSMLNGSEKCVFALALFARSNGAMGEILRLIEGNLPNYIARFDDLLLTGGVYNESDGKPRLAAFLALREPMTGELRNQAGFSNARFTTRSPSARVGK